MLEQDVFAVGSSRVALLSKDTVLSQRQIETLKQLGVENVYVEGEEEPEPINVPPPRQIISPQLRDEALQNITELFDFFRQGSKNQHQVLGIIKDMDTLVDQLVKNLKEDENALIHIAGLKSYDDYTYHHSLSVAVLSVAIGQALKLEERQLHLLGKCAMMHDIGKISIPIEIINKPGKLEKEEFNVIKRHSPEGYQYLNKYSVHDPMLLSTVLFHHERYDGSGYPYGLKGNKIPLFSRIIAVADVYDALTSPRAYRTAESPGEAVEYVMGNAGVAFDYDIIRAMLKKVELYPVGSVVLLSNGLKAVVTDNKNTLRPMLKVLKGGAVLDLNSDKDLLNLTIKDILPAES